ncbi:hypothetical protein ABIE40_006235 [Rhizobium sp. OAE497]
MANRDVIVIGGSTGAIKPLNAILGMLPGNIDAAVLVVIHVQSGSAGIRSALARIFAFARNCAKAYCLPNTASLRSRPSCGSTSFPAGTC